MRFAGGESVEMSLKHWMTGGRIMYIPCSRVGHVMKGKSGNCYPQDERTIQNYNKIRAAEVWMDDLKYMYFDRYSILLI